MRMSIYYMFLIWLGMFGYCYDPKHLMTSDEVFYAIETAEKPASERLMENGHPPGYAAGRNPEE